LGDLTVVNLWKVSDLPYKYLFRLRAVEGVLKLLTDAALFNLISSSAACNAFKSKLIVPTS
jgi:hypothetical protein